MRVLQNSRVQLVKEMITVEQVLELCVSYSVIHESLRSKIVSKGNDSDRVRQLLDEGISRCSSDNFDKFCAILYSTGNDKLGQLLRDAVSNSSVFTEVLAAEEQKRRDNNVDARTESQSTGQVDVDEDDLQNTDLLIEEQLFADFFKFQPFSFSVNRRTSRNPSRTMTGGRCLIISCKNFDYLPPRVGNEVDQMAFETLFQELKFEYDSVQDVRLDELEERLALEEQNLQEWLEKDERWCFVLVVLSYRGSQADTFLTSDECEVRLSDVMQRFASGDAKQGNCSKLFVIYTQTRSGEGAERSPEFEFAPECVDGVDDAFCLCASNPVELKVAGLKNGTWFPLLLALIMSRFAHCDSWRKMVKRMTHLLTRLDAQLNQAVLPTGAQSKRFFVFSPLDRLKTSVYFDTL